MVVFFLLGPFSPEPVSFTTLGVEELPQIHSLQSPAAEAVGGVGLSLESVQQQGLASRKPISTPSNDGNSDGGIGTFDNLFGKKRTFEAIEKSNSIGEKLVFVMNSQAAISNLEKRISIAERLHKPTEQIDKLYAELESLLAASTTPDTCDL